MDPSTGNNVFDHVMDFFTDEVVSLGNLGRGVLVGRQAREELDIEALYDRHEAITKALEYLSEHIAHETYDKRASIKSEQMSSDLLEAGLVNILFGCLPSPDAWENSTHNSEGSSHLSMIYGGFKELLKYLFTVIGRKEMENFCDDQLLGDLFATVDWASASSSQLGPPPTWKDKLLRLAWETRDHAPNLKHKPPTVTLLEYLRWEVQGRKDISCPVDKPWEIVDLKTLRRSAQPDLSRLPRSRGSRKCANCAAPGASSRCRICQPKVDDGQSIGTFYCNQACRESDHTSHAVICRETRDLSRLARLFQTTFVQFLLSIHHGTAFIVSEQDGVVNSMLNDQPLGGLDLNRKSQYVGVSPDLDLSLPKVETALHGFHCCDIKWKARALLEFFFSAFCESIQFINFTPKNAHTPLEVESDQWFRFNMSAAHTVALLTTPSGCEFILDPTAAQFGWKEYLVPWETYLQYRVDIYDDAEVCENPGRPDTPTEHTPRPWNPALRAYWTAGVVEEAVLEFSEAKIMEEGGLERILQLPQARFHDLCINLKEELGSEMRLRDASRISPKE